MFEQTFKNIDDILHKDAGCGSELDYVEQTSWILFLKYLDDLERDKQTSAELSGKKYAPILAKEYKWNTWAAPKTKEGKIDHQNALTGDDLIDFVNGDLFPYLKKFKKSAENAATIEYKIGEIFSELKNRLQSGYNLREVINRIDELRFRTHAEKHEMSHLYEDKIKNMGNAGRNGGEYYTPRPLIKTIVKVVAPEIGDKIYDGAVGSAGFLVEAFEYLKGSKKLSTTDINTLQKNTFYGKEKKSLAYIIGTMNMILHGIEAPNIVHTNTLAENLADIQESHRFDVVLANPPFGGKERAEVQQNFPIKTGETASLFLQHFIKILKAGGKAGVVIKNTFLSNTDNASVSLRKLLLENCNLHTVLDLPGGTFIGANVKTVVLFFEKGSKTKKVWFYQLNLGRNLGKQNSLNEKDLEDFVALQKTKGESENSWTVNVRDIDQTTFDLSVKNPYKKDETALRQPNEILEEIKALDEESADILNSIMEMNLQSMFLDKNEGWINSTIGETCNLQTGGTPSTSKLEFYKGGEIKWLVSGDINQKEIYDCEGRITELGLNNSNAKYLPVNSVLIALNGQGKTRGTVAMLRTKATCNQSLVSIYPKDEKALLPELVFSNLEGRYEEIRRMTGDSGNDRRGLNMPLIRSIKFSYPRKINDQKNIIKKLDELRDETKRLEAIYQQKINNLDELKKSILQKAFSGKLTAAKSKTALEAV